ncbi:hypothetical protein LPB136_01405 [Tenacibaculum todarodis]|uniref:Type I restriction modification DNA specificity domain-containing protein n=1 Tax=Tenacibaculum todarodis TaxID=1850252 RepID=A0A1L3JG65_9FLAO|nr:restriction endonuclease subunit S [Tenacibaculum todarodis]APG64104.1 hypothetical protein LPB136_01405 [Tenacibaculum todarodis]
MTNTTTHTKPLKPKLRFKEFEGEWEEKKFGDLVNSISSGKIKPGSEGEFLVYGSTGVIGKSNQFTHEGEYILIARVGANAGRINRVSGKYAVTDNTLIIDSKKNILNNCFTEGFLEKFNLNRLIFGSGQPLITGGLLKGIKINLPTLPEQQKIANFLTAIDNKIQQLQRKKELLETYKKGVMQQLFSQQLRFKPDESVIASSHCESLLRGTKQTRRGKLEAISSKEAQFPDWEEKKLGELCNITTGKLDANAMVENGQYRFYTCAKNYFNIDNFEFDTNALIISGNGANVGYIHHYKGKFNAYQRTYVLDEFVQDIFYMKYFLDKFLYKRIFREKKDGNTPYIVMTTLTDMKILIPTIDEQQKIASYLSAIDSKIANVASATLSHQQFKKGLLQQLFV